MLYSNIKETINLDEEQNFYVKENEKNNKWEIHTTLVGSCIPTHITIIKNGVAKKAFLKKVQFTMSTFTYVITYHQDS